MSAMDLPQKRKKHRYSDVELAVLGQAGQGIIKQEAMKPGEKILFMAFWLLNHSCISRGFMVSCSSFDFFWSNFRRSRRLACIHHTLVCHREAEVRGRGDPAGWIASSLRSSQ